MRRLAIVTALVLLGAAPSYAQVPEASAPAAVSVTPFVGTRLTISGATVSMTTSEGEFIVRQDRTADAIGGADVRIGIGGPLSLIVGGAYGAGGAIHYFLPDTAYSPFPDAVLFTGDPFWLARAGLSARIQPVRAPGDTRRLPTSDLFVAGTVVNDLDLLHPGVNFGFLGNMPLGRGVEFSVGADNTLIFWNRSKLEPAMNDIVTGSWSDVLDVQLRYRTSNVVQLRAGLTLRP